MKISNLLYMGALSTLALMSCTNNDDNSEWYGSEGIVFTTAIQSRVSGNTWNANDEVGIYMMNAGSGIEAATAQNKKYIAQTNGTLTAAPGNGIYLPESGNVDFIAYYPYTTSVSGNKLAVNVSDQSNPAAIDLIYSNGTKGVAATTSTTIRLGFTHQLTKVTLNVTKDETIETLNGLGVNIKGVSTEGEFNLADGTLTATAGTNNKDVAMYIDAQGTTATATAIILPTAASTDQTSLNLTFNLNGQSFTHTISDASIFEKGKNVSFYANLSINNGKPVVTIGAATIEDWTEKPGGDINVDFDGEGQPQPGEETILFQESFGTPEKDGSYWPYFDAYNGFDNPATMFENTSTEKASVRIASDLTNVWFPANKDITIAIKGINAQENSTATLEFQVGSNVYNAGESQDLNTLKVVCNGQELTIPSKIVSGDNQEGNVPFTMTIENVTVSNDTRIEFSSNATTNKYGLRLYSVKLFVPGNGSVEPEPEPEPGEEKTFFTEAMSNGGTEANKAKIGSFTGWDNSNLTFSDESGNADVRSIAHKTESNPSETAKVNNVWLPSGKDSKLTISGINTTGYSKFKLSYEAAANVFNAGTSIDLNVLKVTFNAQSITIPSKVVSKDNNDANVFYTIETEFEATGSENSTLEFSATASDNTVGLRIYNIKLIGLPK